MYEFSVVPRALFTPDGFLHQTTDKSSIASEIRKVPEENHEILPPDEESGARKAMLFGGMAVVNPIDMKSRIKTHGEFSEPTPCLFDWLLKTLGDDICKALLG